MKKYLMTGIAALAMGGIFTSCGPDMSVYNVSQSEQVLQKYEQSFVQAFGEPAPTQTWGFGSSTVVGARGTTRTITVNGDAYDKFPSTSDIAGNFPTAIPENADEVSQLETSLRPSIKAPLFKANGVQFSCGICMLFIVISSLRDIT